MLGEFCSRRNDCLVATLQTLLLVLLGLVSFAILTLIGWILYTYFYPLIFHYTVFTNWSFTALMSYFLISLLTITILVFAIGIPVFLGVGLYQFIRYIIKVCKKARKRYEGYDDL
jgi:hypothetical protein